MPPLGAVLHGIGAGIDVLHTARDGTKYFSRTAWAQLPATPGHIDFGVAGPVLEVEDDEHPSAAVLAFWLFVLKGVAVIEQRAFELGARGLEPDGLFFGHLYATVR